MQDLSRDVINKIKIMMVKYMGKPLEERLRKTVSDLDECLVINDMVEAEVIDDVLGFLEDTNCLNVKGKALRNTYWEKYIKS